MAYWGIFHHCRLSISGFVAHMLYSQQEHWHIVPTVRVWWFLLDLLGLSPVSAVDWYFLQMQVCNMYYFSFEGDDLPCSYIHQGCNIGHIIHCDDFRYGQMGSFQEVTMMTFGRWRSCYLSKICNYGVLQDFWFFSKVFISVYFWVEKQTPLNISSHFCKE